MLLLYQVRSSFPSSKAKVAMVAFSKIFRITYEWSGNVRKMWAIVDRRAVPNYVDTWGEGGQPIVGGVFKGFFIAKKLKLST